MRQLDDAAPGPRQPEGWRTDGLRDLQLRLERRAGAPALGRAAITDWSALHSLDRSACELLRLLVSELVTNAVVHAHGRTISLAALWSEGKALVTVTDGGGAGEPGLTSEGFGLQLVDAFALEWGVEPANGSRVWFVLEASARPERAA